MGTLICAVTVAVKEDLMNSPTKIRIICDDKEYNILYYVGMDYGIVLPEETPGIVFKDDVNMH